MRYITIFVVLLAVLAMISCTSKMTAKEYFEAGYESYNNENYQEALTNFKNIVEEYPESEFTAKAMFMVGFINANHVENFEEAKEYYEMFISKYPDHELAASAKYELDTLGKDIEELPIFKKIEEEEGKEKAE